MSHETIAQGIKIGCSYCRAANEAERTGTPPVSPIDSLQQQVAELTRDLVAAKRTEKFLRYYECCDDAVKQMTDAVLKAAEDTPMEGDVENLVMNLDQFRKQRDEARSRSQSDAAIVEAARRLRAAWDGPSALREGDSYSEEVELSRAFIAAVDAAERETK